MRDPEGGILFDGTRVLRTLKQPIVAGDFLQSALCKAWADSGQLVAHRMLSPRSIESPRLPFVSHPSEWCDSQLYTAAQLSLTLAQQAMDVGFDLKDASAWNILFIGQRPVFCDLLSFQPLQLRPWWAAGQFARHFLLPLLLSRRRGLRAHQTFLVWRDGMPPDVASRMLGWSRFAGLYWPLMTSAASAATTEGGNVDLEPAPSDLAALQRYRRGLLASLAALLKGVAPLPAARLARRGQWVGYSIDRAHYPGDSVERKRNSVSKWLTTLAPSWVADLGCNEGEFSRMALDCGANVVAIDSDHDCIDALFSQQPASDRLHPVMAQIDDPGAGRGWAGSEFPGLLERLNGRVDLVMMLALLHHLAVGAAVPLSAVAAFAARLTSRHLIIEWIESTDPQLLLLCAQRRRNAADFSLERQREAFLQAGFVVEAEVHLQPAARLLALMRRDGQHA